MEQNLSSAEKVVASVCDGAYGDHFRSHFGGGECANKVSGYNAIACAVAAFEASAQVNAFSSKYDYYLKDPKRYPLTDRERLGLRPSPDFVKAYMHNGAHKALAEVVHFYNTRDTKPACEATTAPAPSENCWPAAETAANINTDELGDLGLTAEEEAAIVSFMKTLSDGWTPPDK